MTVAARAPQFEHAKVHLPVEFAGDDIPLALADLAIADHFVRKRAARQNRDIGVGFENGAPAGFAEFAVLLDTGEERRGEDTEQERESERLRLAHAAARAASR